MMINKGYAPKELIECDKKHQSNYLKNKKKHKVDGNCYASKIVKSKLSRKYNYKCAYCDSIVGDTSYPHVEHYRPKDIYYWLVYSWDNLLYSCEVCNKKKGTKFPKKNKTITIYTMNLDEEEPLILNPEKDNLIDFYKFNANGNISAKNSDERAKETIWICDLNRFVLKYKSRKKILDNILNVVAIMLDEILESVKTKQELKDKLKIKFKKIFKKRISNNDEHSLMLQCFLVNFDETFKELYSKIVNRYLKA